MTPQAPICHDVAYRKWIEWSYARRLELWDANNAVTRAAGGPECIWVGMNGGNIGAASGAYLTLNAVITDGVGSAVDFYNADTNAGSAEHHLDCAHIWSTSGRNFDHDFRWWLRRRRDCFTRRGVRN